MVGALRFADFMNLILRIEDYKEQEAKRWQSAE